MLTRAAQLARGVLSNSPPTTRNSIIAALTAAMSEEGCHDEALARELAVAQRASE